MGNIDGKKADTLKNINDNNKISGSINESFSSNGSTVKINEYQTNYEQNKDLKEQSNSYSLLTTYTNLEINENNEQINKNKKKKFKKYRRKKNNSLERNYMNNIKNKKSIIGICLNLFFWIWTILLILDHNNIIRFPRASPDKKMDLIFTGANNDSFFGGFLSTLLSSIFHYIFVFIYPEIIFIISYIIYVVYSIYIIPSNKFRENNCLLSHNMYIFFVVLTLGEIYKLFARKYLDV